MITSLTKPILGFDEVGRGALAGPVVVACVLGNKEVDTMLPKDLVIRDSKKMSNKQRERSALWIKTHHYYGIGQASSQEIDSIGIVSAVRCAAQRALLSFTEKYGYNKNYTMMVDGCDTWFDDCTTVIKGDALIPEISCASIVAKVYRDNLMRDFFKQYPNWGFERHVGYGTQFHRRCILSYGLIPDLHRNSFCSRLEKAG